MSPVTELAHKTLGKYEIHSEISRGSMGMVYLASDPFMMRDVAIKVALPETLKDEQQGGRYRKLFFNEAKVAGKLRHPNIVQVYDIGVDGDVCYIVMELVCGGKTLHEHCRPGNLLPLEDVVRVAFKCARALDYAHRQGVIHRDVKPKNILTTQNKDIKVSDFSIALTTHGEDTQVHGYVGSPLYMSPEQIREETVTNQSDIFSLGALIYELLTGQRAFSGDTLPAIVHQITERPHVPVGTKRPDVPPVLSHIVDRSLRKRAEERYKTALELAADLSLVFEHIDLMEESMSQDEKFAAAKALSFFATFTDPEVTEIVGACTWKRYAAERDIVHDAGPDNSFYLVVRGDLRISIGGHLVETLHPGDCFGEPGNTSDANRNRKGTTLTAITDAVVMHIGVSQIEQTSLQCQTRFYRVFLSKMFDRLASKR